MADPNVFFITGEQRSGTTLLSVMLSKHSKILLDSNSVGFRLVECFDNYREILPYNLEHSWNELQQWLIDIDYKGRLKKLIQSEDILNHANARSLLRSGINHYLESNQKRVFGDKSPNIHFWTNEIRALLPKAKIIHLVRDGRSVALSRNKRSGKNLYLAGQEWVDSNIMGCYHASILGDDIYKFVKFEDLLISPEQTLKELCNFIGVEFEPAMLESGSGVSEEKSYVKSKIDQSKIDSFKDELSKNQIRKLEKNIGNLLKYMGYNLVDEFFEFKEMTISERILLSQKENFLQLFRSKVTGMRSRENIDVEVPMKTRLATFGLRLAADLFPQMIYKRILRRKRIKNVKYKKSN